LSKHFLPLVCITVVSITTELCAQSSPARHIISVASGRYVISRWSIRRTQTCVYDQT